MNPLTGNEDIFQLRTRLVLEKDTEQIIILKQLIEIRKEQEERVKEQEERIEEHEERELKKRQIDLEILREKNKLFRPQSPHKLAAIFIFMDKTDPVGTCFAVNEKTDSGRYVLTACHNLRETRVVGDKYFIAEKIIREISGHITTIPSVLIEVELIDFDFTDDWAILRRTDSIRFKEIIEVQHKNCVREDLVKTYHCPVSFFTQLDTSVMQALLAVATSWCKVTDVDSKLILAESGLVQGSSGGVMIDKEGKAVAIYLYSISVGNTTGSSKSLALSVMENPLTFKEGRIIALTSRLSDYFS